MSTGTTLYYPYIHPRNSNYMKSALLYWDRIRRIVPNSVTHGREVIGDSDDAKILTQLELLVTTPPEPYQDAATKRFLDHVTPHADRFRIEYDTAKAIAARNGGIHVEKIGMEAIGQLQSLGLAEVFGSQVGMYEEVGAFYLFCLASEMAGKLTAPLYTDSPDEAELGQTLLFEPKPGDPVSDILVSLGIRMPSPVQLQQKSMKEVADFAQKRQSEKMQFREAIESIIETARQYGDPNALNDYFGSERKKIKTAVDNLNKSLDEFSVGKLYTFAKITIPTAFSAAGIPFHVSPTAATILGGFGLAMAGIACFAETRGKLRQAKASSPYHYLVSVNDEFGIKPGPTKLKRRRG
jgi:hypothetical protein